MIIAAMPVSVIQWLHLFWCVVKVWTICALFVVAFATAVRLRE